VKKPVNVHETVCIQAKVTVTPNVEVGEIEYFYKGGPVIGACKGEVKDLCSFMVRQKICVQVPLAFSATAQAEPAGIVCGLPEVGSCPPAPANCTHTLGFYRNNPDITNALITSAGGSIVLGTIGQGLSFTVTPTNAAQVLNFNTPSPPAPASPPFAQQYRVLYAQLLTARLNVQNGAGCAGANTAVAAANEFLATSPTGGKAGAPAVQEQLAEYNEGDAEGCPEACDE